MQRALPTQEGLSSHCKEVIGPPRILALGQEIFVAIGFDLANIILIRTKEGNVIIDAGSSPARAGEAKEALLQKSPGPILALIYTHSHIDHTGGASAWVDEKTPIWATQSLTQSFFTQYGLFRSAESRRGAAQFGLSVPEAELPCSSLGRRIDLTEANKTGVRLPNQTFSQKASFEAGGLHFELYAAPGETQDHLFVWVPELKALFPGDNYYRAFPNLYTIRGTSPRPIDAWISSLDQMRRFSAEKLVPSHTPPIEGKEEISSTLTNYRDGIQWVRDRVIQAANQGKPLEEMIASLGLPPRLAQEPSLKELYGQLDWSARAIYDNNLGWFTERPEELYPVAPTERAQRTVAMMGGVSKVRAEARRSLTENPRWSLELLALVRDSGLISKDERGAFQEEFAEALRAVAKDVTNTNGRAYLLEAARLATESANPLPVPSPDEGLVDAIPLRLLFQVMQTRLLPEKSLDAFETVYFEIDQERFIMTVRYGVAELIEGEPLPGTPEPLAIVRTDGKTWRRVALGVMPAKDAIFSGAMKIEGEALHFYRFSERFQQGI